MLLVSEPAAPPAGGAALDQVLIAAAAFAAIYVPLGIFLLREREGRPTLLGRLADRVAALDGLPRWAGLPGYLALVSLIACAFGVYWDVPIHMQNGRDEGPLANPSHFPIMFGIFGFLASGVISAGLAKAPLPRRTVRLTPRWRVPMGTLVLLGAGLIAAAGFPADDVWHRLFGQDVTEWGPTHVMMIGGAVTCVLALPLLYAEAAQVGRPPFHGRMTRLVMTVVLGLCIIPVAFLMEFDLGVPQFPATTLFVISGFLTGWIFVAGRIFLGRGGALVTWATYIGIRVLIYAITLPVPDIHRAHWLLFLGPALCIELLALVWRERGPFFAGVAGLLAGSLGLATEWWWMDAFLPYPLPPDASQMPLMLAIGGVAGVGGGLLGWSFARHVERIGDFGPSAEPGSVGGPVRAPWVGTAGTLVFIGLMAVFAAPAGAGEVDVVKQCDGDACRTTYQPVDGTGVIMGHVSYDDDCIGTQGCTAVVTVRADPDDVDDAIWFSALAYQGKKEPEAQRLGDGVLSVAMEPTGRAGEYRSAEPLPLYGRWKVLVRLHLPLRTLVSIPVHMPADTAIKGPAAGLVQVDDDTDVAFVHEPFMLQRERKPDVPVWLWTTMYGVVIASWLGLLAFYGWLFASAAGSAAVPARQETAPAP